MYQHFWKTVFWDLPPNTIFCLISWISGCRKPTLFLPHFLFSCFFEKVDLIWPLRPIPHVEKTRKWILSSLTVHLKSGIWIVITSRSLMFLWQVDFDFKALKIRFSLRKVGAGLLYLQNMVIIFSEYKIHWETYFMYGKYCLSL